MAGLAGCGAALDTFPFDRGARVLKDRSKATLQVTYFSVGCTLIRCGDLAVLTDPFWSHVPLCDVAFGDVLPDAKSVRPYLPLLADVRAVIVGHTHYDHVLGLSLATDHLHSAATIIGSRTLGHLFAANRLGRPVVAVNDMMATHERAGQWLTIAGGRIRVLPIRSGHPSQYLGFHLYRDRLTEDRTTPPTEVQHYQEGATVAYLVDFMATDLRSIQARVYVQTSSTGYPAGFFPAAVRDQHRVNAAILAMDCANIAAAGGRSIIDFLRPDNVIFCHWEDFFSPKTAPPEEIVKVDLFALKAKLKSTPQTRFIFPAWDTTFRFATPNRSESSGHSPAAP